MKRILFLCAVGAATLHAHEPATPGGQTPPERIRAEESLGRSTDDSGPWAKWDHASGSWFGARNTLLSHGVDFFGGMSAEVWGNPTGGIRPGATGNVLFNFGVEIDLETLAGWQGATLHNSWFAPLGRDLSAQNVGNTFTVSNAVAYNSLYLYELWFQQVVGPLSVRVGQLAADTEFAGSDHGALFLNSAFGWPPFLSGNLPNVGPAFPKGTPGARVALTPVEWLTLQSAVYQGNPYEDAANRTGTRWHIGGDNGWTWMHEAQLRWNPEGRPGQLKLGAWTHTGRFADLLDETRTHSGNYGFYGVIDQTFWRPDPEGEAGLGWFVRAGGSPKSCNLFAFYADSGFTWRGITPSRADDTLGLAVAWGCLSSAAREATQSRRSEVALELTYQCQVTPWMSIQPDVQWIIQPGASAEVANALVFGLRAAVVF